MKNQFLRKRLKIAVPLEWNNNRKGKFFEDFIANLLEEQGWEVRKRINTTGTDIDILAESTTNDDKILFECKFHDTQLIDAEIIFKALGVAETVNRTIAKNNKFNKVIVVTNSDLNSEAKGLLENLNDSRDSKLEVSCWTQEKLKQENKIMVIFFDQFEELFSKESLFFVYEDFEKLAYEVDSIRENLVLGFCWRTGILIPDDHKARGMWDKLNDKRTEIKIQEFSESESNDFLDLLYSYLSQQNSNNKILNSKVKEFLKVNCSGYPWILKRLCSEIYNSKLELIKIHSIKKIIKNIFEEDLGTLTNKEIDCLKYVSRNSPIALDELYQQYGNDVIQRLEEKKFLIKTGVNYAIYWDILREFILNNQRLPSITLKYKPRVSFDQVWEIIEVIKNFASINNNNLKISISEISQKLKYPKKQKTIQNAILDLINFFDIEQNIEENTIIVPKSILQLGEEQLAEYLSEQWKDHIIVQKVYEKYTKGKEITLWGMQEIIKQTLSKSDLKPKTYQDYTSRIISWLLYAGILEKTARSNYFRLPKYNGKEKGKPKECKLSYSKLDEGQQSLFPR